MIEQISTSLYSCEFKRFCRPCFFATNSKCTGWADFTCSCSLVSGVLNVRRTNTLHDSVCASTLASSVTISFLVSGALWVGLFHNMAEVLLVMFMKALLLSSVSEPASAPWNQSGLMEIRCHSFIQSIPCWQLSHNARTSFGLIDTEKGGYSCFIRRGQWVFHCKPAPACIQSCVTLPKICFTSSLNTPLKIYVWVVVFFYR